MPAKFWLGAVAFNSYFSAGGFFTNYCPRAQLIVLSITYRDRAAVVWASRLMFECFAYLAPSVYVILETVRLCDKAELGDAEG